MNKIVFFDLETGGLQARPAIMSRAQWKALEKYDRGPKPAFDVDVMGYGEQWRSGPTKWRYCPGNPITQIAAIACRADTLEPLEEFEVKLRFRPELAAPEALELNSYDEKTWKAKAARYPDGLERFRQFLDRHRTVEMISKKGKPYMVAQLAGHNAAGCDLEFLLRSFEDPLWQRYALPGDAARHAGPLALFFPGSFSVLDTLQLARWCVKFHGGMSRLDLRPASRPADCKLETLTKHFGIEHAGAHDALADVRATIEVARILRKAIGS